MDFSQKKQIIEDLREKYGDEPLIRLFRTLILTLDEAKHGSDAYHQSLELLQVISGERIPGDPGEWLDWLEDVDPEKITWEGALVENKQERIVYDFDEDEDEEESYSPPVILSKEQALWTKALKKSKSKSKINFKVLVLICLVAAMALGTYFKFFKGDKELSQGNYVINKGISPLLFWGNYHTLIPDKSPFLNGHKTVLDKSFFSGIHLEDMKNEEVKKWIKEISNVKVLPVNWYKKAIWTFLWKQESNFFEDTLKRGTMRLNINTLQARNDKWHWTRYSNNGEEIISGKFIESLIYKKGEYHWEMKRVSGNNGSVHYFVMNQSGLRAWVWKLFYQGDVYDGVLKKIKSNVFKLQVNGFDWKIANKNVVLPKSLIVSPAIWSPLYTKLNARNSILPISGKMVSSELFKSDISVKVDEQGRLIVSSELGGWYEVWKRI